MTKKQEVPVAPKTSRETPQSLLTLLCRSQVKWIREKGEAVVQKT